MQTDALLVVRWMAITAAALAVICCASAVDHVMGCLGESKADVARLTAHAYADNVYREWAALHPGECPRSVLELAQGIDRQDDRDPWGNRYGLLCASPATILVISAGEDGMFGTADDIRSDQ